jgi:hypothetical protein
MARLSNIKLHQDKKQAVVPEERTITPLNARFTPTTAEEALDVKSTEAVDPKSQFLGFERTGIVSAPGSKTREADLTNMNEETFLANQDKLNASGKEYWAAQVKKDPTSVYAAVNEYLASSETPEEKRKRERREAVGEAINGLGNLIGNVANLYYAPRSGYSIDLNTMDDKRRERMERIQAKRDALDNQRQQMILNAKIGQMNAERAAAEKKAENERQDAIRRENQARDDKKRAEDLAYRDKELEIRVKNAKQAAEQWQKTFDQNAEQAKNNNAYRWAELNWRKNKDKGSSSSSSSSSSSGGSGKGKVAVIDTKKGVMNVDFGKINQTTYNQLYNNVSEETKKLFPFDASVDDEKTVQMKMNQAIAYALQNEDGYADWFEEAGIGTYNQQPQVEQEESVQAQPVDYSQYLKSTNAAPEGKMDYSQYLKGGNKDNTQAVQSQPVVSEPTQPVKSSTDKYASMITSIKEGKQKKEARKQKRIEETKADTIKTVNDAKSRRSEIMRLLSEEYPERNIDKMIKDAGLSVWEAKDIRKQYANDMKERSALLRELDRLNMIINNR